MTFIGATGNGAIYYFETYTPTLPLCSLVEEYKVHEITSTGRITYPSSICQTDLCTAIDIDVT